MEKCGGARVDCDAKDSVAGVLTCDSTMQASIFREKIDSSDGCGCADWDVLTARQQSWLQHPLLRIARWSRSEPWHWCAALRIQQACGGVEVAASASGTKVPTNANNSRNLAVSRCMPLP
ncbi:MAG: hypothetical protein WCA27_28405 [Candidatus Sulfotelmatobacter sp.]